MNVNTLEWIGRRLRPTELALVLKWLLRIKRKSLQLKNGTKYYIDPISDFGLKLLKYGEYEQDMTLAISSLLKKGDSFLDIGSNEGFFSVLASKQVGNEGKIFSIEPQKRLWEILIKNFEINHCTNVQLLPYGIGSKQDDVIMNLYPTLNSGASSLSANFNFKISFQKIRQKIYGQQSLKVITLDSLIAVLPNHIKLAKIDIEGFECEAVLGAEQLLKSKRIENLLIEMHPNALESMGQSEDQITQLLSNFGYQKKPIAVNLNLYYL